MTPGAEADRRALWLSCRTPTEHGFTLVETIVTISIAAVIFISASAVLTGALGASLASRQNQISIDVLSDQVEKLRAASYESVTMSSTDLAGDLAITGPVGNQVFDPDGAGPLAAERIVATPVGSALPLHQYDVTRNRTPYRTSIYITDPPDATGNYRRITAIVRWRQGATNHMRTTTTFVTNTRRGLPLPKFVFGPKRSIDVTRGTEVRLAVSLTNRGARDRWDIELTQAPSWPAWTVYVDTNANGVKDVGEITPLGDTSGNAAVDTGLLEVDAAIALIAVTTVPAGQALGNVDVTTVARSVALPAEGTRSIVHSVNVVSGAVPPPSFTNLWYLHNKAADGTGSCGNTTRIQPMLMNAVSPTCAELGPNYDTNVDSEAGRALNKEGDLASGDQSKVMIWRGSPAAVMNLNGHVYVNIFGAIKGNQTNKKLTFKSAIYLNGVKKGEGSLGQDPWGGGFRMARIDMTNGIANVSFTANPGDVIEIRLVLLSGSGSNDDSWVLYGTQGSIATVELPVTT